MDSDWLGRLVDRHAAALELFARQWCDTPEDVVQEAFVKLASARTPPENPSAWLFRVVRNGALNAAQAARRRRRHESEAAVARDRAGFTLTIRRNIWRCSTPRPPRQNCGRCLSNSEK